ncbi:DUF4233 domain-containing protein [Agreia pratensis]|uniref:DUF4233 domain-containing protein n=1 Tax=Agreia pratensis TaxID=150121 RepID=A0A1X7L0Q0_9MICO|nr:DUF4233 domain-containing protein [Agreia pratensis]SMG47265.1 Protein of unknown function [Agreia pratensis]
MTDIQPPAAEAEPLRPTRPASVRRSLGSIVLGFESIVMFLAALVAFGLKALPALPALGGGAVLCVALVAGAGLLRFRWGYAFGWVLQAAIIASAFLVPVMWIVGILFVGLWTYCMVVGARIDREKAAAAAVQP